MNAAPVVIYDGHCRFCQRQVAQLQRLTRNGLTLESFHDAGVLERYGLSREVCEQAIQLVRADGNIFSGMAALVEALRINPMLAWMRWVYWVPGIQQVSDAAYRWVSNHRQLF